MTDKSITNYSQGEYLQFQRDLIPETTASYSLGTRYNPFYQLNVQQVDLKQLPVYDTTTNPDYGDGNYTAYNLTGPLPVGTTTYQIHNVSPALHAMAVNLRTGTYTSSTGLSALQKTYRYAFSAF